MKILKFIIFFFLLLFGITFSCRKEPIYNDYFEIIDFVATNYKCPGGIYYQSSCDKLDTTDTVYYGNYKIELFGIKQQITQNNRGNNVIIASDINEIISGKIKSINIITANDFNESFSKGSTLNSIFVSPFYINVDGVVERRLLKLDSINTMELATKSVIELFLIDSPSKIGKHSFFLSYL